MSGNDPKVKLDEPIVTLGGDAEEEESGDKLTTLSNEGTAPKKDGNDPFSGLLGFEHIQRKDFVGE